MWEESSPERESGKIPPQNVELITTPPESEASPFCLGKKTSKLTCTNSTPSLDLVIDLPLASVALSYAQLF